MAKERKSFSPPCHPEGFSPKDLKTPMRSFVSLRMTAKQGERGNAMVYVLVIVALFAALSFILSRQGDTGEAGVIDEEKRAIHAGVIQQGALQLQQAIEQMLFIGAAIGDLDFVTPDDTTPFNNPPHMNKVFHPQGGGVILPRLPDDAVNQTIADPPARWYISNDNDIEWTPSTANDVMLTAYQLTQDVCERLNDDLTGDTAIPVMSDPAYDLIFFSSAHSSMIRFTSAECAGCFGRPSLCVEDSDGVYSFYSLIAGE